MQPHAAPYGQISPPLPPALPVISQLIAGAPYSLYSL
jgi:hypothetical protein